MSTNPIDYRKNYLRTVRFENPDFVPMFFIFNDACYHKYEQDWIFDMMESHPFLFPNFVRPQGHFTPSYLPYSRKDHLYTDDFGCVWKTVMDGIVGVVVEHPLADLDALDSYIFPDPEKCTGIGPINWSEEKARIDRLKEQGQPAIGGLRHGHTFLQLCDIRGYENLLMDMFDEEPRLTQLIGGLEEFNLGIVKQYLAIDLDVMTFAEDLGMQIGPMLSPELFRKYIKPSYKRLMAPAREMGKIIHMHSDGDIRTLVADLIDGGVDVVNLQDLVNGVDWIADNLAGKICVDLDIDRQSIIAHGTPKQIDSHIREAVEKLGSKKGGLMMCHGLYPGVPECNAEALMDAMERFAFFYS